MALRTLTMVDLYHFITCEDLHEYNIFKIAFDWGPGHIWLHTTLEGMWSHNMILEVWWDGLWTLSFGLSQFHGHGSWLVCEVALNIAWELSFANLNLNGWYLYRLLLGGGVRSFIVQYNVRWWCDVTWLVTLPIRFAQYLLNLLDNFNQQYCVGIG